MKTLFRRSCLGLLLIVLLGGLAAVSVFAIVFQQSQAVSSSARLVTPSTPTNRPTSSPMPFQIPNPGVGLPMNDPNAGVTIQVNSATTTPVPSAGVTLAMPTDVLPNTVTPMQSADVTLSVTATDVPRYSGTSSYPMTVTAEVMLAQTHVAVYEAGVGATRTAIAAESALIYATLTAAVPQVSTP